jgi:type VI secretion system protein ImpE
MARKTEWKEEPEQTFIGLGQRVLVTDEGDSPLLQCRLIDFSES